MNIGLILGLVIGFGLLGLAIGIGLLGHKKLVQSGQIVSRDTHFMEKAEIFILNEPDPAQVVEQIKTISGNVGIHMKGSSVDQWFKFDTSGWEAKLEKQSPENGKCVYRFQFTHWNTYRGMPEGALAMNKLLTAVEKMFVSFDHETVVKTEAVNFNTKTKLF